MAFWVKPGLPAKGGKPFLNLRTADGTYKQVRLHLLMAKYFPEEGA